MKKRNPKLEAGGRHVVSDRCDVTGSSRDGVRPKGTEVGREHCGDVGGFFGNQSPQAAEHRFGDRLGPLGADAASLGHARDEFANGAERGGRTAAAGQPGERTGVTGEVREQLPALVLRDAVGEGTQHRAGRNNGIIRRGAGVAGGLEKGAPRVGRLFCMRGAAG